MNSIRQREGDEAREVKRFSYIPIGGAFYAGPKGTVVFTKVGEDHAIPEGYKGTNLFGLTDKCYIIPLPATVQPEDETTLPALVITEKDRQCAEYLGVLPRHSDYQSELRTQCRERQLLVALRELKAIRDKYCFERNDAANLRKLLSKQPDNAAAERDALLDELSACKETPGGCGYWREAAKQREAERDALKAERDDLVDKNRQFDALCKKLEGLVDKACDHGEELQAQLDAVVGQETAEQAFERGQRVMRDYLASQFDSQMDFASSAGSLRHCLEFPYTPPLKAGTE